MDIHTGADFPVTSRYLRTIWRLQLDWSEPFSFDPFGKGVLYQIALRSLLCLTEGRSEETSKMDPSVKPVTGLPKFPDRSLPLPFPAFWLAVSLDWLDFFYGVQRIHCCCLYRGTSWRSARCPAILRFSICSKQNAVMPHPHNSCIPATYVQVGIAVTRTIY